jgi:heat shock protein 1/8
MLKVRDAERYKQEDALHAAKIKAKNDLEGYTFNLRNMISEGKVKEKLGEKELKTLQDAVDESSDWIDSHKDASKDEYDLRMKQLEKICNPIVSKVYASGKPPAAEKGADDAE